MIDALVTKNLSFSYGTRLVLEDVSLRVEKGQFCGLVGPNGAGKSTLFSLLTGLLPARDDAIEIAGIDMAKYPRKAHAQMGIVFQDPSLELDMSVEQNMRYFAALHGLYGPPLDARIEFCLEQVNLADSRAIKMRKLNGGHRRRMEIARALLHEPAILLLDEPTAGLDVYSRRAIVEDVHKLTEMGISVLWATHLVDEIWPDDHVVIIDKGTVKAQGFSRDIAVNGSLLDAFFELTRDGMDLNL